VIHGGGGGDTIYGDAGEDDIYGEAGADTIDGGDDDDLIFGGDGTDGIGGGEGDDDIYGGNDADTIHGNDGRDRIWGQAGGDFLYGDAGNDTLRGESGGDLADGGTGDDVIYGGAGIDDLRGGADDDRIYGGEDGDTLAGGPGADLLFGEAGDDVITGDAGDDQLDGGDGVDNLSGGGGEDFLFAGTGVGNILSGGDDDDLIVGSDEGALTDPDFDDTVYFGDVIDGGPGNDRILALGGADDITGGDDDDWIDSGIGADRVYGGAGDDWLYAGIGLGDEMYGEAGDDVITGAHEGDDTIDGGPDNDELYGQGGGDIIDGGEGHDYLDGGIGIDTLTGGNGNDEILGGGGAGDTLSGGAGNDILRGSDDGGDIINGGAGEDVAFGNAGNDTIAGGDDNDVISGGLGDDTIHGNAGSDLLVGQGDHDTIYGHDDIGADDDGAVDTLYGDFGTNADEAGSGQDRLYGGAGNDLLFGEADDDLIVPGAGTDDLVDYGSGESGTPGDFVAPTPTADPALGTADGISVAGPTLPTGADYGGRWAELAGSAGGLGLGAGAEPSIATAPDGSTYAAWADPRGGNFEIYVAKYTDAGGWVELGASAADGGVSDTTTSSRRPAIAIAADGQPIVAWTETDGSTRDILAAKWDPTADGGAGDWVALGTSLGAGGISGTGTADDAAVVVTAAGPVVAWLGGSVRNVYARRFGGGTWDALDGSATGTGISGSATSVHGFAIGTGGTDVAVAWSQDTSGGTTSQIHLLTFSGGSWADLGGSNTVDQGLSNSAGESTEPAVAYHGGDVFVAWREHVLLSELQGSFSEIHAKTYTASTWQAAGVGADTDGGASDSAGQASQPRLAANGGGLHLLWADDTVQSRAGQTAAMYAKVWSGTAFVAEIPGDAAGAGIAPGAMAAQTIALAADASGRPVVAWTDQAGGSPAMHVRANTFELTGTVYTADGATSVQQVLDANALGAGDVIHVVASQAAGFTVSAADAGVTIIGAEGVAIGGAVAIDSAAGVTLQRLTVNGNVTITSSDSATLRDSTVNGDVTVSGGTGARIVHNTLNGATALTLTDAVDTVVSHNTVTGSIAGIVLAGTGATTVTLVANTIGGAGTGIAINAAAAGTITGNDVQSSSAGLALAAAFASEIADNDIHGAAVGVSYAAAATLSGNRIYDNTTGVVSTVAGEVDGFGFVGVAEANDIYDNDTGVDLTGSMQNQHVHDNTAGVIGSGALGGTDMALANVIAANATGVDFDGTIQFNRIAGNTVGIAARDGQWIAHNLIYGDTTVALQITGRSDVRVVNNTFYATTGDNIRIEGGSDNVEIRNNILWAEAGYDIYVANDSQQGFFSDYNDLHAGNAGTLVYWTKDFTDILDWQADVAKFDLHSIGRTVVHPQWSRPRFANAARGDFTILDLAAGQRFTSPMIDAGDPLTDLHIQSTAYQNLLANPGFESGVTGWTTSLAATTRAANPDPFEGGEYFFAGNIAEGIAEQTLDLIAAGYLAGQLDSQDLMLVFGGRVRSAAGLDTGQITVTFLDDVDAPIGDPIVVLAENEAYRWELIGDRVAIPAGARSVHYRFRADRESGTENNSYIDGAFLYVLDNTVMPNQGGHGNTDGEAAGFTAQRLALRAPDLYLDWERAQPRLIRWDSFGNTGETPVRIDLYQDGPSGPELLLNIVPATPDTGEYIWIPSTNGVDFDTAGLRVHISITGNQAIYDRSTESFTVPEDGFDYFVNDAATGDDEYTSAAGSNRNTGKNAAAPKPNPVNLLRTYELTGGATLNVDTGVYPLIYTVTLSGQTDYGLGLDRGFVFRGPAAADHTAQFVTAIPGNTGQTLVFMDDADLMDISGLTLTAGKYGLHVTGGTTGLTARDLTVHDNAQHGILIQGGSAFALLEDIVSYNHIGSFDGLRIDGGAGGTISNFSSYNNRYGLFVTSVTSLDIDGAVLFDNRTAGLNQDGTGTTGTWDGIEAFYNAAGLEIEGQITLRNARLHDNDGTGVYVYRNGYLTVEDSEVFDNNIGIDLQRGLVRDSRIYGNLDAGVRATASAATLTGNTIYSNRYGLYSSGWYGGATLIRNNLFYDHEITAIRLLGTHPDGYDIVNNTIYEPLADGIRATGSADDVRLRNNIIWTRTGYGVYISDTSQGGFTSEYNLLYTTDTGRVGYWQGDRDSLMHWQFATFQDALSLSDDPLFVDAEGADGVLGAQLNQGLQATYYAGGELSGPPVATALYRTLNARWSTGPDPALANNNWSGSWDGHVRIPVDGLYTFYIHSEDGQRLEIDGALVIDDWDAPTRVEQSVTLALTAGLVPISYQVKDTGGYTAVRLKWLTPLTAGSKQTIRSGYLRSAEAFSDGSDDNFHIQSPVGSYRPLLETFVADPTESLSPALDRGDPADAFDNEPLTNGGYVNLGAYGNTVTASKSPAQYVLITHPAGGELLPQDTHYDIRWRSDGFAGDVKIEYSSTGASGPFGLLDDNEANDGTYDWFIDPVTFGLSDQYAVRITSVTAPAVLAVSELFSVGEPIAAYYVNDTYSPGEDEYTAAAGDDANDGLSPSTPKASIRAIIEQYDLEFGDIIYVDTGTYNLTTNIIIEHEDSGVIVRGPIGLGHTALLDRGNIAGGSYVFELNNADAVALENLAVTGGYYGIFLTGASSAFTLQDSTVYENAHVGLYINDAASSGAAIRRNVFYGNAADNNHDQNYGIYSKGLSPTIVGNEAYHTNGTDEYGIYLDNAGAGVVIQDNTVYNNHSWGLYVVATEFEISGNVARDNQNGFYFNDTTASAPGRSYNNTAWDSVGHGFQFNGNGEHFNNEAHDNGTGLYSTNGFYGVIRDSVSWRNTTGVNIQGNMTFRDSRVYGNNGTGLYMARGNSTVRGNLIYDNTTGIHSQAYHGTNTIINNVIYDNSARGILLENVQSSSGTTELVNNTVMELDSDLLQITGSSQNVHLRNNILWAGGSDHVIIRTDLGAQRGFQSDYNQFHFTGGAQLAHWQTTFSSLGDWRCELGFDTRSISGDPLLVGPAGPDGVRGIEEFSGLQFEGFDNVGLGSPPAVTQIDYAVNFNTYYGYRGLPNDDQSYRWSGQVYLTEPGAYTFYIRSDGPQRLYVDDLGTALIDDWVEPSGVEQSMTFVAAAAGWVDLVYEAVDDGSTTRGYLAWITPETKGRKMLIGRSDTRYDPTPISHGLDDDFHLQSTVASYHGGAWLADGAHSAAIDAGDLADLVAEDTPAGLDPADPLAAQDGDRVNLGAYGNTDEASRSPATFLRVVSPNGSEKYRVNHPVVFEWQSVGEIDFVKIELSLNGGGAWTTLSAAEINDGDFAWIPDAYTLAGLVRVSDALDPGVSDTSDTTFTVGDDVSVYYVNDLHDGADQYTTADGANTNTGTRPDDPMASLAVLLSTYELDPGDTVYVDAGIYPLVQAALLTADHAGITLQGPTNGNTAVFDRGNSASGQYAFTLANADGVTLSHLDVTGGERGIQVDADSDDVVLEWLHVYDNSAYGVVISSDSDNAIVRDSVFHGDAPNAAKDQPTGLYVAGRNALIERNTAYHVNGRDSYGIYVDTSGPVTLIGNEVYENSTTGLWVQTGGQITAHGNTARNNNEGLQFQAESSVYRGDIHDNVAHDNATGMVLYNYTNVERNTLRNNTTGLYLANGFAGTATEMEIFDNTTGVNVQGGTLTDSRIYGNSGTGVYTARGYITIAGNAIYSNNRGIHSQSYHGTNRYMHNVIYDSAETGVLFENANSSSGTTQLTNNTVYETAASAVRVTGNSKNVQLRNNILQAGGADHYAISVADGAQVGFASDYNLLHTTDGAELGLWQAAFNDLADWQLELNLDLHSVTGDPAFVDPPGADGALGATGASRGADDNLHVASTVGSYSAFDNLWSTQAEDSPAIDAGDPADDYAAELSPVGPIDPALASQAGGRINLGAYGNSGEASRSPESFIQLLSFTGGQKVRLGQASLILWRSGGIAATVDIDFIDESSGSPVVTPIATGAPNSGVWVWNPAISTLEGIIRITGASAADPLVDVVAQSHSYIVVGQAGHEYYVNDVFDGGTDQYTTADGDNDNSGTTPADPMASLNALLNAYNMDPGDVIYVDAGTYNLVANVVVGADDAGVLIAGPTNGNSATLDRGNVAAGRYVLHLSSAADVEVRNLTLTGGEYGLVAHNADRLRVSDSLAFHNAVTGFHVDSDSANVVVMDNEAYGTTGNGSIDQNTGFGLYGYNMLVQGNTSYKVGSQLDYGFYIDNAGGLTFQDNLAYNNNYGARIQTDQGDVHDNIARDNNKGFWLNDDNGSARTAAYDNTADDNDEQGFVLESNLELYRNVASRNATGIHISSGSNVYVGTDALLHAGSEGANLVFLNDTGVSAQYGGTIRYNRIFANTNYGVRLQRNAAYVIGNAIYGNSVGVFINAYYSGHRVTSNVIYDNANEGIYATGASISGTGGIELVNNTVHHDVGTGIRLANNGSNVHLYNNIVHVNVGAGISVIGGTTGFDSDYNNVHLGTVAAEFGSWKGTAAADLPAWQAASGEDENSMSVDPGFQDYNGADNLLGWERPDPASEFEDFGEDDDFQLAGGSPMIDAAHSEKAPTLDAVGQGRWDDPGTINTGGGVYRFFDLGAYEFQSSSTDITPPTVTDLQPVGMADDTLSDERFTSLDLSFSETLNPVSARSTVLYALLGAGADEKFDTGDDVEVEIAAANYTSGEQTVQLVLNGQLPQGYYRLTIYSGVAKALVDESGNMLDGDEDAAAGGNFVRTFRLDHTAPTVVSVDPAGPVATGPTHFVVTFTDNIFGLDIHLDATTIEDTANYTLTGSVDELFEGGDDTDESARITGVTYDAVTHEATVQLSGPLPGARYQLALSADITDLAGNPLESGAGYVSTLIIDIDGPAAEVVSPAPASIINVDAGYVDVRWTDGDGMGVNPATIDPADVTVTGVTVDRIEAVGDLSRYWYNDDADTLGEGEVTVGIAAGVVLDLAGNPNDPVSEIFTYDITGPQVTAVGTTVAAGRVTAILVDFDEDLNAATAEAAANYALAASGGDGSFGDGNEGDLTGRIGSAAYDAGLRRVTLTLTPGLDDEVYQLTVVGTTSVEDLAGNRLNDGADEVRAFTADNNVATASIALDPADDTGIGGDNITSIDQPTFIVTVNEAGLIGVDYDNDTVIDETQAVAQAGAYPFSGSPVLADGDHTVGVTFTDTAGGPVNDAVLLTVDTVPPTVDALDAGPDGAEVTFSTALEGTSARDAGNYVLTHAGPNGTLGDLDDIAVAVTPDYTGGATLVTLTPFGTLADGLYELRVRGTATVTDVAGNPLGGGADHVEEFTVDHDAITVVAKTPDQGDAIAAMPEYVEVTYSEPVDPATVEIADLTLTGSAILSNSFTSVDAMGGNTFRYNVCPCSSWTDGAVIVTIAEGAVAGHLGRVVETTSWSFDYSEHTPIPGDANDNGFVDDTDMAILLGNWENDPLIISTWELGNFTEGSLGDTDVDDNDLAVLLGNWTGPPPGGSEAPAPTAGANAQAAGGATGAQAPATEALTESALSPAGQANDTAALPEATPVDSLAAGTAAAATQAPAAEALTESALSPAGQANGTPALPEATPVDILAASPAAAAPATTTVPVETASVKGVYELSGGEKAGWSADRLLAVGEDDLVDILDPAIMEGPAAE